MFHQQSTALLLGACALALGCAAKSQSEPAMQPASGTGVERVPGPETRQSAAWPEAEVAGPTASESRPANSPATAKTSGPAMSPDDAVTAITQARCERELECRKIGLGRKFTAMERCEAELGADTRQDLGPKQCRAGHDPDRVGQCLREIASADCSVSLDSLDRLLACPRNALCR